MLVTMRVEGERREGGGAGREGGYIEQGRMDDEEVK
jgi:hypothetical protein